VFVVQHRPDGQSPLYLRFAPAALLAGRRLSASADTMAAWSRRGILVAHPLRSVAGALVERVATPLGPMSAMLVPAADGEKRDIEGLTEAGAAEWGAALGILHRDGSPGSRVPADGVAADLPLAPASDPELVEAAAAIRAALHGLDPSANVRGLCHGDFELDNLRFGPAGATCFDADEAHIGWFAGDVAIAARDLTGATLDSVPRPSLLHAFLSGYRSERPFTVEEERSLPLHSAAVSLRLVVDVDAALDDGSEATMPDLRAHLAEHRAWHRRKVLEWAGRHASRSSRSNP
jgi:Ser/Thr protein kinase RdoA (MazF antagonist)